MLKDHAIIEREGFKIPLIGIPPQATIDECDCCHDQFSIRDLEWNGQQLLCKKCKRAA